ncbi:hypothetical protein EG329_002664 [Mollisiaceae sp. DMI_Dod_QoI]|nr:hypothetical protein EG329_002664 [Helotiales sp. DMI_Dod_QoI]
MVGNVSRRWPYQPNLISLESSPATSSQTEDGVDEYGDEKSKLGHAIFDIEWKEKGSRVYVLQITDAYGLILVSEPPSPDGSAVFSRIGVSHFVDKVKIRKLAEVKII